MARAVSDESLARALGLYAGMAHRILGDPERWLGDDDPDDEAPGDAGVPDEGAADSSDDDDAPSMPRRVLQAVRRRTLGKITPGSDEWEQQPLADRVDWWVSRIAVSAGVAAAAPRFAGALADRVPLQAALGASAAGLAVCAVAREHGVVDAADWVPLLATVLFERELPAAAVAVPEPEQSEQALTAPQLDPDLEPEPERGTAGKLGGLVQRSAKTLWRLAMALWSIDDLLDERPRGGFVARTLAKLPVVGLAGGWLDERGAIRKAAEETAALLSR